MNETSPPQDNDRTVQPAAAEQPANGAQDAQRSAAQDAGAEVESHQPSMEAQLADAEARCAEYMELYLRARAEMDNFRKRAQADVAATHKFAIEGFAESLLPVKDSLELALKADTPTVDNLREGVTATLRLMVAAFEKHKLLEIDPVGEKFDPNRHQAISMVSESEVPANHVVSVLQKGYLINDRVIRPALVTVRGGS